MTEKEYRLELSLEFRENENKELKKRLIVYDKENKKLSDYIDLRNVYIDELEEEINELREQLKEKNEIISCLSDCINTILPNK